MNACMGVVDVFEFMHTVCTRVLENVYVCHNAGSTYIHCT